MANLGTRTKNINIVIRKNKYIDIERLNEWLGINCDKYAYIMHEKDINLEGVVEGVHYHLVITLNKVQRLSTTLTSLCEWLEFDNPFGIEIDKTNNLEGSIQYLIHKNDKQKTQHELSEVVHNWAVSEMLTIMNSEATNGALTIERVKAICQECDNIVDVIEAVGFGRYHLYRPVIQDIFKHMQQAGKNKGNLQLIYNEYNSLLDMANLMLKTWRGMLSKSDKRLMNIEKWENELALRFKHYE